MRELVMTTLNTFTCNLDITICLYSMLGVDRTQQADLQIAQVVHLVNHLCWGRWRDVISPGSFSLPLHGCAWRWGLSRNNNNKRVSTFLFVDGTLLTTFLTSNNTSRVRPTAALSAIRFAAVLKSASQLSSAQAHASTLTWKFRRTSIASNLAWT
jgi:hypothetical protein